MASKLFIVLILLNVFMYVHDGSRRWFTDDLPSPLHVRQWSNARLNLELHTLSRWDGFSVTEFRSFVRHQLRGLAIPREQRFRYLEVGVGVGAFAREMLRLYPHARGYGFDIEERAVSIAAMILPRERFHCAVGDMLSPPTLLAHGPYDYIIIPGALCYLHSQTDVVHALERLTRQLKRGGRLCASMLPDTDSEMGSCNTRVPRSLWTQVPALHRLAFEEMNDWNLTKHALGRYSACAVRL
jgi:SAM-dependent methyltransferase